MEKRRTLSSRVHKVLGGSLTRLRVKSPVQSDSSAAIHGAQAATVTDLAHRKSCSGTWRGGPPCRRARAISEKSSQWEQGDTHEMMPNAWYSFTAERLMRPNRPCCIPRRKRTTATLGEGCGNTSASIFGRVCKVYVPTQCRREPRGCRSKEEQSRWS